MSLSPAPRRARRALTASRAARTAGAALVLTLALAALSGCGIRPSSGPVNAGEPAVRTACPPTGTATPTALYSPRAGAALSPSPGADATDGGASVTDASAPAALGSGLPTASGVPTVAPSASPLPTEPPSATPSCLVPSGR